jgi:hypothetical protein
MSVTESEKAWMSVRDAALVEALLMMRSPANRPLQVLEWGSGRSTLAYSDALAAARIPYLWLTLEHHREFFLEEVAPTLNARGGARHAFAEDSDALVTALNDPNATGVHALVYDAGELRPFEAGDPRDRDADLDFYVDFPTLLDRSFDVVLIDGRKRRRCLLAIARLLASDGMVVLHDGWRRHYQCAFSAYSYGTRLGDELWVGAQHDSELQRILPVHAFERHADEHGNVPD